MGEFTDYKLQRVLTRFPWRRRKPRTAKGAGVPIAMTTREGQQLWADPGDLAEFSDPGPALVCVAMHSDRVGHALLRHLLEYHAHERGIALPEAVPAVTTAGLELLDRLLADAGLDPDQSFGPHALGELLTATWAIAAATDGAPTAIA